MNSPTSDVANSKAGQIAIILIVIVVIIIVFIFINKFIKSSNSFLEMLGLKDSKDTLELNNDLSSASGDAAKGNWLSPSYYKNGKPGTKLITRAIAEKLAKEVYDSVGYVYDDSTKAAGAIKQLQYKSQVSFMADIFQQKYGKDMKAFMDSGFDTEDQKKTLVEVYNYVKKLPSGLA